MIGTPYVGHAALFWVRQDSNLGRYRRSGRTQDTLRTQTQDALRTHSGRTQDAQDAQDARALLNSFIESDKSEAGFVI